ncbi:MAG: nuclear transport factor 2 family protein [Clostridia bacterium]|nr:nuclear transport factor 2 family protein [Clostridia bacterium]
MNNIFITEWINTFVKAWKKKDFTEIKKIFADTNEYYEVPLGVATCGIENILKLWEDIVYQEDIILKVDPIICDDNIAILHWYFKYKDSRDKQLYEMDGIYYLQFNDNHKCVFFKQWWVMSD